MRTDVTRKLPLNFFETTRGPMATYLTAALGASGQ